MIKKIFTNSFIFGIVLVLISVSAGTYYYNRVIQKDSSSKGQISYLDFKVFWTASYNLKHHIIRKRLFRTKDNQEHAIFAHFWFLNPRWRNQPANTPPSGSYLVYDKKEVFYHYRYSPFVAFAMIPLGKISNQGNALIMWYLILNTAFFSALLLIKFLFDRDFHLPREGQYLVLWGLLLGSLRFYLLNISLGQTDILSLFLFVLFLLAYVRNKEIICGICLAMVLQFKPFFLPILIYFLFTGKKKLVVATIITFVALLFIPSYMLGMEKTIELLRNWTGILNTSLPSQTLNYKNQSIIYAIGNVLLRNNYIKNIFSPMKLLSLLATVLTLSAYVLLYRFGKFANRRNERKYKYLEISILLITSVIFSPIAWKSYFIVLTIPLGLLIFFAIKSTQKGFIYTSLGTFFILSCVLGTDLTKFIPAINNLKLMNIAFGAIVLALGLLYAYRQNPE